jgi:hypothetical protein
MPQDLNQLIDLIMQGIGQAINVISPLWPLIALLIKVWVYIIYFIPMLGMKLLKFLGLWPSLWPFN